MIYQSYLGRLQQVLRTVFAVLPATVIISCQHHRQLPAAGTPAQLAAGDRTSAVSGGKGNHGEQVQSGYDSLRQCYDSLDSRYKAGIVATDRMQTRLAQMDTALRKKDREIADLRRSGRETGATVSPSKIRLQEELKEVKAANQTLTELGSVLHVSNIKIMPIHMSANGRRVRSTSRARKTNDLKLVFDIDANYVSGGGDKTLYLVITDPGGALQKVDDWISGATQTFAGAPLAYTLEKKVTMKENEPLKNVNINCRLSKLEKRGRFRFAFYHSGYLVGEKSLTLE